MALLVKITRSKVTEKGYVVKTVILVLIRMAFLVIRYLMLPNFFMISYYCNSRIKIVFS